MSGDYCLLIIPTTIKSAMLPPSPRLPTSPPIMVIYGFTIAFMRYKVNVWWLLSGDYSYLY